MQKHILRLTTIVFSLFSGAMYSNGAVEPTTKNPHTKKDSILCEKKFSAPSCKKEKKCPPRKKRIRMPRYPTNEFFVKLDNSGDISKYQAACNKLIDLVKEKISPITEEKRKEKAIKAIKRVVKKVGTGNFKSEKHYQQANTFMDRILELKSNFQDEKSINKLESISDKLKKRELRNQRTIMKKKA